MSLKVLLVGVSQESGWPCGTRVYAEGLRDRLAPEIEIEMASLFLPPEMILAQHNFDVLHLNFAEGAPYAAWTPYLAGIKQKKVWTFHHAGPQIQRDPWFELFDKIIVNQPIADPDGRFLYIPQPIPEVDRCYKPGEKLRIASHGFPIFFKRMREICMAATLIGDCEVHLMCARSPHADVDAEEVVYRQILGERAQLLLQKDWLSMDEVVYGFQRAHVAVFGAVPDKGGQSAAVLPAVAAGTPLVVSDSWHFNVIKPYALVADFLDVEGLAQAIAEAARRSVSLSPLLEKMNWRLVAEMHRQVYLS